jgi:hypothetical protein
MGQGADYLYMHLFAGRVGRRQAVLGLIFSDRLRTFEALRQQMHQGGVDIVDAVSQPQKFWIGSGHIIPFIGRLCGLPLLLSEGVRLAKFPAATEKSLR